MYELKHMIKYRYLICGLLLWSGLQGCEQLPPNIQQGVKQLTPARSLPQAKQDYEIRKQVGYQLYGIDTALKNSEINLDSIFGSILLTGRVPELKMKNLATQRAKKVSDVVSVHNYITVGGGITNEERQADEAINQQIISLLKNRPLVKVLDYRVVCHDKNIYVIGRMTKRDFNTLMAQLQTLNGARKIISLVDFV